jgi:hypothetical protein
MFHVLGLSSRHTFSEADRDIPIPTKSLSAVLMCAGMKANFISPDGVLPRASGPCPKRAIPLYFHAATAPF